MTTNSAQSFGYDIPSDVTANECMTISECSLCKVWTKPNLRTRITMWMARIGIGVRRFKNSDDLFVELNK
jgi:hypothetical protein